MEFQAILAALGGAALALGVQLLVWRIRRSDADRDRARAAEQELRATAERYGRLEQRFEKMAADINHLWLAFRELRTVVSIAGETGEVPRMPARDSGQMQRP